MVPRRRIADLSATGQAGSRYTDLYDAACNSCEDTSIFAEGAAGTRSTAPSVAGGASYRVTADRSAMAASAGLRLLSQAKMTVEMKKKVDSPTRAQIT
jgi:hypothetical protein